MNTIGIIGALDCEVELLKEKLKISSIDTKAGLEFYVGEMFSKKIIIVRCGIGKVNASVCAQILVDIYNPDCIINIGIAGAIHKDLDVLDVVISTDLVLHDFDTTYFGDPLGVNTSLKESFFKADPKLIKLAEKSSKEVLKDHNVFLGRIATGDIFIAENSEKEKIWDTFNAYCTEMEGAAIAQVCYLNEKPFVVIRAISDKADDSATLTYEKFSRFAAENSSRTMEKMLQEL